MPALKYLYPEYIKPWDQERKGDDQVDLPLTNVVSDDKQRDVYNNPQYQTGENTAYGTDQLADKLPLASPMDPGGYENPAAGGWFETGPAYCDTCGKTVIGQELALPTHLGHDLRYGDAQQTIDIDSVHKTGGGYRIEPMYSTEPSNPNGMTDPNNNATTKPIIKGQEGNPKTKSGYSWCPKPIETDDWKKIQEDDANVNENTVLLNTDDRTVRM